MGKFSDSKRALAFLPRFVSVVSRFARQALWLVALIQNSACFSVPPFFTVFQSKRLPPRSPPMHATSPASSNTCDLCDAHKDDANDTLRVLPPVFRSFGGLVAFSGPVTTIKCHEDNTLVKAALDSAGEGRVLVVDGGGSLRRALVGGNLAAAAVRNGWAGIVVDGCVRDVVELQAAAVGIRALAPMPLPTEKRGQGQRDAPVQIQGVWVRPGDWLYADADGIVVSAQPLAT